MLDLIRKLVQPVAVVVVAQVVQALARQAAALEGIRGRCKESLRIRAAHVLPHMPVLMKHLASFSVVLRPLLVRLTQ